jgi:hypothetical protein
MLADGPGPHSPSEALAAFPEDEISPVQMDWREPHELAVLPHGNDDYVPFPWQEFFACMRSENAMQRRSCELLGAVSRDDDGEWSDAEALECIHKTHMDKALAFAMGQHHRAGWGSPVCGLQEDVVSLILLNYFGLPSEYMHTWREERSDYVAVLDAAEGVF